jgi:hypothetical protein
MMALLANCPRLELLANFWSRRELAQDPPVRDVRLVMGVYTDYSHDWEEGAQGLRDFWSVADDFVA